VSSATPTCRRPGRASTRRHVAFAIAVLASLAVAPATPLSAQDAAPATNPDADHYIVPPESVQRIFATDKNYATLDYMSPDSDHFLVIHQTELSTLALMSKETYRLAELELRPQTNRLWHLDTYGIDAFRFYSLSRRRFIDVDLPDGSFASDFTWSPEGDRIAFLAHLPAHTEVWTAEAATGRTRRVADAHVLATVGTSAQGQGSRPSNMLQWTPQGTLLTLLVPSGRGPEPADSPIPTGPLVRHTRPEPTRTPTYPNLLQDAHDEDLFEYYTTSQLAELAPGRRPTPIGAPRMYESISLSPDGAHILAEHMERPFSYITSYRSFPRKTVVMDRQGTVVSTVDASPLREGRSGFGGGNSGNGPRSFAWRPDGAGLSFLMQGVSDGEAPRPDRIMLATAPFDLDAATVVAESSDPIQSVSYSLDGRHAFASVTKNGDAGMADDLRRPPRHRRSSRATRGAAHGPHRQWSRLCNHVVRRRSRIPAGSWVRRRLPPDSVHRSGDNRRGRDDARVRGRQVVVGPSARGARPRPEPHRRQPGVRHGLPGLVPLDARGRLRRQPHE
jgi:hypothetical protein